MRIHHYLSLLLVSATLHINTTAASTIESQTISAIEKLKRDYRLPSISVAIALDNDVSFAYATGLANIEKGEEASVTTQYSVGSIAKPMTGLLLAKLADQGDIDIAEKVSRYVEDPAYTSQFSVAELAAHLAGVPHETTQRDITEFENPKDHYSPFEAFGTFEYSQLAFEPGTQYQYSSHGYILLSAVVEAATETNFVKLINNKLFTPFQAKDTELDLSTAGTLHEATYYATINEDGDHVPSTLKRDRSFLFGAGGFISTPSDLVRIARATYHPEFLSQSGKQLLSTPVNLRSGQPNSENYSIGWRVSQIKLTPSDNQTWTALHHGGVMDKAATAYLLVIPECKASIAFATNFVPDQFWQMRSPIVRTLLKHIDVAKCQQWK